MCFRTEVEGAHLNVLVEIFICATMSLENFYMISKNIHFDN